MFVFSFCALYFLQIFSISTSDKIRIISVWCDVFAKYHHSRHWERCMVFLQNFLILLSKRTELMFKNPQTVFPEFIDVLRQSTTLNLFIFIKNNIRLFCSSSHFALCIFYRFSAFQHPTKLELFRFDVMYSRNIIIFCKKCTFWKKQWSKFDKPSNLFFFI